jgi:hypothetical protein
MVVKVQSFTSLDLAIFEQEYLRDKFIKVGYFLTKNGQDLLIGSFFIQDKAY